MPRLVEALHFSSKKKAPVPASNDRERFRKRIQTLTNAQLAACADELLAETHRRLGSVPQ